MKRSPLGMLSNHNTITLGNGDGDTVTANNREFANTIILGNGACDAVNYQGIDSLITLGNGAGD